METEDDLNIRIAKARIKPRGKDVNAYREALVLAGLRFGMRQELRGFGVLERHTLEKRLEFTEEKQTAFSNEGEALAYAMGFKYGAALSHKIVEAMLRKALRSDVEKEIMEILEHFSEWNTLEGKAMLAMNLWDYPAQSVRNVKFKMRSKESKTLHADAVKLTRTLKEWRGTGLMWLSEVSEQTGFGEAYIRRIVAHLHGLKKNVEIRKQKEKEFLYLSEKERPSRIK